MQSDTTTKLTWTTLLKLLPVLLFIAVISAGGCATLGIGDDDRDTMAAADTAAADSTENGAPKPYEEVITEEAITDEGLFTIHKVGKKWYFEIPDSLLGREMMVANRLAKAPIDNQPEDRTPPVTSMLGYAGDLINKTLIRFERGPDHTLFIRGLSYSVFPDSTSPMYRSVMRSSTQPIIKALDIKAIGPDSTSVVVNMTEALTEEKPLFAFGIGMAEPMQLSKLNADRTYVKEIKSFPINTEIRVVRTYDRFFDEAALGAPQMDPAQGVVPSAEVSTMVINSSIILLPKVPMEPRYYDNRVGFFATGYTEFDPPEAYGAENRFMVTRWKLRPREEDMDDYLHGELVEPKEPIVYYIDPATPEKWVPYIMQGVNDWQKAFRAAGFKNAIMAKKAPAAEEDSTWSLWDARYSAIVYKPSSIANASGPHLNDPRSGQILESHINWYHSVTKLLRNWYLVQASPSDTAARHARFSEELMGQLIRFVVSHEVGHTMGLRHNMGASYATPVEKLRDKAWLKKNGHTASIMDYARFNYVAQPQDSIGQAGLFPRINDYDLWTINWGYRLFPKKSDKQLEKYLSQWVTEKVKNPRLRFISGEYGLADPRAQTEDLGNNAMKASAYGIKNLKYIIPKLSGWVVEQGEDYEQLQNTYLAVVSQYLRYVGHVIKNIGGLYYNPEVAGQPGDVYEMVPEVIQRNAMAFVSEYALQKPEWLFNKDILNNTVNPSAKINSQIASYLMDKLLNNERLLRLISMADRKGADSVYTVLEYMKQFRDALWSNLETGDPINGYRRTLQNFYIKKMGAFTVPLQSEAEKFFESALTPGADVSNTDIPSIARYVLRSLKDDVTAAIAQTNDKMTRIHLKNIKYKIEKILEE